MSRSDLPEPLATQWERLSGDASVKDVHQALLAALGPELRLREYVLHFGAASALSPYVELLDRLAALELAAAPVVVATHKHSPDLALVTCYASLPGEELVPISESAEPVPQAARERLRAELLRLYQAGYVHPAALQGHDHWLRARRSGTLALTGWQTLRPVEPGDDVLEALDSWLARLP
jgi:hypothetical protein